MSDAFFRAGVGILVMNAEGLVLAGERASIPGAWQAPQGGIRVDEQPLEAAYRELREETGLEREDVDLIEVYPTWLGYELPEEARSQRTGRGQVQRWFLFRLVSAIHEPSDLEFAGEFHRFEWWPMGRLVDTVWHVRRPIYEQIADYWSSHFDAATRG